MYDVLDIAASGLTAQRARMDTIAGNLASMNVAGRAGGPEPFRRRFVLLAEGRQGDPSKAGVRVKEIRSDPSPFQKRFEPGHPYADKEGYVLYPNVDLAFETVNAIEASRAYEANVTMMEVSKAMMNASLRLIA
jgi:flagellar basal-body rod protein FlgC